MRAVQLDEFGSICCLVGELFDGDTVSIPITDEEYEMLYNAEDMRDYTLSEDGSVVPTTNIDAIERKRVEEVARNYQADTDAALFDLDEAQRAYESETDAALFDLVDYIASLEARIAELEVQNG